MHGLTLGAWPRLVAEANEWSTNHDRKLFVPADVAGVLAGSAVS